jgi:hypothetical protein
LASAINLLICCLPVYFYFDLERLRRKWFPPEKKQMVGTFILDPLVLMGQMGKPGRKKLRKHDQMVKNDVWEPVKKNSLPKGTKVIDSTWVCKNKSMGKLCRHLNACRFKQVEGVHYDGSSTHAPVTNTGTIRIMLILMLMADWHG